MKKLYLFLFALLIVFVSCKPRYYRPTTQLIPLFKERHETRVLAATNFVSSGEFKAAYAVTNHIAIQAGYGFFKRDMTKDSVNRYVKGQHAEFGLGYFMPLEDRLIFEVYGLGTYGNVENLYGEEDGPIMERMIKTDYSRYSFMPVIGYRFKYASAAISLKASRLDFYNYEGLYQHRNVLQTDYLERNKRNFLLEPAFTIRGGTPWFQMQFQTQYSFNASNRRFAQDRLLISLGLLFVLPYKKNMPL